MIKSPPQPNYAHSQHQQKGEASHPTDWRGRDLRDITLDGKYLCGIDFSGADLRGANLSEAVIERCCFKHADLVDVCMAEARLLDCDFRHARFGATIIAQARFDRCRFAGPSALMLPWRDAAKISALVYETHTGGTIEFAAAPVVMMGSGPNLARLGTTVLIDDTPLDCIPFVSGTTQHG